MNEKELKVILDQVSERATKIFEERHYMSGNEFMNIAKDTMGALGFDAFFADDKLVWEAVK